MLNHQNIYTLKARMKKGELMELSEDILLMNQSQTKKIKYLEKEGAKKETYIKDLQQSLKLNKQSMLMLAQNFEVKAIRKLQRQNSLLQKNLKKYQKQFLDINALLLIEQQMRIQERKFYNERIIEFENKINEFKKCLEDKEQSFTDVLRNLKKYEDLGQVFLKEKLMVFQEQFKRETKKEMIKQIAIERDRYKKLYEESLPQIDKLAVLKCCLESKASYQVLKRSYAQVKVQQSISYDRSIPLTKQKILFNEDKTKNSSLLSNPNSQQPHAQLIRLLKKQKLATQLLEQALNQTMQKNEQLIQQNNILVNTNLENQLSIERLNAQIFVLQRHLAKYQLTYKWKLQWKPKCDMFQPSYQFQKNIESRGDEDDLHLEKIVEDVNQISEFIHICVPKQKLIKSCSEPRIVFSIDDGDDDDLQIQQI